jgi:hypothetical protein
MFCVLLPFILMGVAFYRKLGLEDLGQFDWRFHNGYEGLDVTEFIFGLRLDAYGA